MSDWLSISLYICAGAFGGFVHNIANSTENSVNLPLTGKCVDLGFLGDMIIGTAAAMAVFFLISLTQFIPNPIDLGGASSLA